MGNVVDMENRLEAKQRGNEVRKLINSLQERNISDQEIADAVGVSRWTLTLWRLGQCEPSEENHQAMLEAYYSERMSKIRNLPSPKFMTTSLLRWGMNHESIAAAVGCSKQTVINWLYHGRLPAPRYRDLLARLYYRRLNRRQKTLERQKAA